MRIACTGIVTSTAAQIYVDAPMFNTTAGDATFTAISGDWDERTTGPGTNAFATTAQQGLINGNGTGAVQATMSLGNLDANATYTSVRIYYIGKAETNNANNWDFDYSYTGGSGSVLDEMDGTIIDISNAGVGAPAATMGDIRYFVSTPDFTTDPTGQIDITFTRPDLNREGSGNTARFVIDGLGFDNVAVPEPSSAMLALLTGGVLLVRRKR